MGIKASVATAEASTEQAPTLQKALRTTSLHPKALSSRETNRAIQRELDTNHLKILKSAVWETKD